MPDASLCLVRVVRVVALTEYASGNEAFRALETSENRSLDAIAVATVAAFTSLQRPARQDRAQIDLLIRPQLHRLGKAALQKISVQLSSSPHAPVQLLHAIAMLPVSISAPLILRNPLLTDDFLDHLVEQKGEEHRQVVLKRDDRRKPADMAAPALRATLADMKQAEQRDTVQRLSWEQVVSATCVGHDVAAHVDSPAPGHDLIALARSSNPAFLQTRIADMLDLPFAIVADVMRSPESGETTALLKAAGLDTATALSVILLAARSDLGDIERVRMLLARYRALDEADARQTVVGWRRAAEQAAPAANDAESGTHPQTASVA